MSILDSSDVVSNLKFIGLIGKHQKINISNLSLQPVGPLTKFKRTFICYENNRQSTLKFVNQTINRSFELINTFAHSKKISEICLVKNIIKDIIKSLDGMDNLRHTYDGDIKFICDLKSLVQSVVPRLKEIHTSNSELFISEDDSIMSFIKALDPEV
jgi:hypothetical protein